MKTATVSSPAKLNLFLSVGPKRSDGYHGIVSVFERVSLCDSIRLRVTRKGSISVVCSDPSVPQGAKNLCFKAAEALKRAYAVKPGVSIGIQKNIPVGSGMGGGSSNAASCLLALNRLWDINAPREELSAIGAAIGSDVPFFLCGSPFAKVTGRGEKVISLTELSRCRLWHVIAAVPAKVSTPLAYAAWDMKAQSASGVLTAASRRVKIICSVVRKRDAARLEKEIGNDLEAVTIQAFPRIGTARKELIRAGGRAVHMTGSGAAFFCIAQTKNEALKIRKSLLQKKGLKVFLARTI